jgi:NDP-sugar pyrophosphorylase family protein
MCTGFQTQQIEEALGDGHKWNVEIKYSIESSPLGTAGALKHAERFLSEDSDFLVMNGDSFLEIDFHQLVRFHRERRGWATIAVRRVEDAARYGTVEVDRQDRIVRFSEKLGIQAPGLVNGGIYVFKREVLQSLPEGPGSLEKDVLPKLIEHGTFGMEQAGMFIDIGTPEDYTRAQSLHQRLSKAAVSTPRCEPVEDVRR